LRPLAYPSSKRKKIRRKAFEFPRTSIAMSSVVYEKQPRKGFLTGEGKPEP